ncbi:hypothetical protein SB677_21170, partial [Bacillus sp. SIMBA_033]
MLTYPKNVYIKDCDLTLRPQVADNPRSRLQTDAGKLVQPISKENIVLWRYERAQFLQTAAQIFGFLSDESILSGS